MEKTQSPSRRSDANAPKSSSSRTKAAGATCKGRPSDYKEDYDRQAFHLCLLGATDKDMARVFDVSEQTFNTWKHKHPSFLESLKAGREKADADVGKSLYQRAMGYSHPDVHISNFQGEITATPITKHYAPDTTACIFWLKNRRPDLWRDAVKIEHSGKIEVEHASVGDLRAELIRRGVKSPILMGGRN